jgi:hypothetical protein
VDDTCWDDTNLPFHEPNILSRNAAAEYTRDHLRALLLVGMDVLWDRPARWGYELEFQGLTVCVCGSLEERHPLAGKGVPYTLTPTRHYVPPRLVLFFHEPQHLLYRTPVS